MEFIFVFVALFMFVSEVVRLASLASLASLGARFQCGVHMCLVGSAVRTGLAYYCFCCYLGASGYEGIWYD